MASMVFDGVGEWLANQRWYGAKDRTIEHYVPREVWLLSLPGEHPTWLVVLDLFAGEDLVHSVTLMATRCEADAPDRIGEIDHIPVAEVGTRPNAILTLVQAILDQRALPGGMRSGSLSLFRHYTPQRAVLRAGEQTHSSFVIDDELIVKFKRVYEDGPDPEFEIGRELSLLSMKGIPPLLGAVVGPRLEGIITVHPIIHGVANGWDAALSTLGASETTKTGEDGPTIGLAPSRFFTLGKALREIHEALAERLPAADGAVRSPEAWREVLRTEYGQTIEMMMRAGYDAYDGLLRHLDWVFDHLPEHDEPIQRIHGDLHLGQTLLEADGSWWIVDFGGEPAREVQERQELHGRIYDVAGLTRSIAYAEATAIHQGVTPAKAYTWSLQARQQLLAGYQITATERQWLYAHELRRHFYEVRYELKHRPDWVTIPLSGFDEDPQALADVDVPLQAVTTVVNKSVKTAQPVDSYAIDLGSVPVSQLDPLFGAPVSPFSAVTVAESAVPESADEAATAPVVDETPAEETPVEETAVEDVAGEDVAGEEPVGEAPVNEESVSEETVATEAVMDEPVEQNASPHNASTSTDNETPEMVPTDGDQLDEPTTRVGTIPLSPTLEEQPMADQEQFEPQREESAFDTLYRVADQLADGRLATPHDLLGVHHTPAGWVQRIWRPDATAVYYQPTPESPLVAALEIRPALFETAPMADQPNPGQARWQVHYGPDQVFTLVDPYAFEPSLGEMDIHLWQEGRHEQVWTVLGANRRTMHGINGVSFAVWAPNAKAVRVIGDFNSWDGRLHPMRTLGSSGIWEIFIPDVPDGSLYKYELITADDRLVTRADPFAKWAELPPGQASRVFTSKGVDTSSPHWRPTGEAHKNRLSIYEVHLGSWRYRDGRPMTYAELAQELVPHVKAMNFTHVEFLPVAEHPYAPSWGYQVTGQFAPTSRFGTPDDFRELVKAFHDAGIGVIVDWVPAHFPKDEWALARFDGTHLYEHADPRQGEHPDWGTLVFNFGRNEVRNFLVASALYWIEEMGVDGLRVDAVASMLYLDYSRDEGQWVPNEYGGRENLEAVRFLQEVNATVYKRNPNALMIAEESTSWDGVSRSTDQGGLGFGFKWNMGWMHDTLQYVAHETVHRKWHHDDLTFGLVYAWSENFILPLSHDEVVHGKQALLAKMPGDDWQKFANLRTLYAWMWGHPGKQLLFMGGEFGQWREWASERELDWGCMAAEPHIGVHRLVSDLNAVQSHFGALYQRDTTPDGFTWLIGDDADTNVLAFARHGEAGEAPIVVVANFAPVPRHDYRVPLPQAGMWKEILNTDAQVYGGSGVGNQGRVNAGGEGFNGQPASTLMSIPPLGVLYLTPEDAPMA